MPNSDTVAYVGVFGQQHTVDCLPGYELTSGESYYQAECDTDGVWEIRQCQG